MELKEEILDNVEKQHSTNAAMRKAGYFFCLLILLELPISILIGFVQSCFSMDYRVLVSILMTQGYLLICAVLYCIAVKQHPVKDLHMKKYRVSTFFLSIVVLITSAPMASWLNVFSQLFVKNSASTAVFSVTQTVPMWLGILIIGCLPGFVEEMLYRGIMYSVFQRRSVLTGIVVSAIAFGLMHLNFNQMAYAIYLGVIFALLVEATGSLVSSMILHMLFNAVNTSYIYILPRLYDFLGGYLPEYKNFDIEAAINTTPEISQLVSMMVVLTPFAIGGLVLTILLLKAIAKINGRIFTWAYIKGNPEEVKHTKPVNAGLILGMFICLVFCVINMFGG